MLSPDQSMSVECTQDSQETGKWTSAECVADRSGYDVLQMVPTPAPSPTSAPFLAPTLAPTSTPTSAPTSESISAPTPAPTSAPTPAPTQDDGVIDHSDQSIQLSG